MTKEELKYKESNHSIHYVGDYRIILGNDTILLEALSFSFGRLHESMFRHNFEKIKYHPQPSSGIVSCAFYFNQKNEIWECRPRHFSIAQWYYEAEAIHQRSSSFDLLDTALTSFLKDVEKSCPKRDLTSKVLKNYKCLVGWCSIEFVKNHLILTLRAVRTEDYKRKKKQKSERNIDDIVSFMRSYEFAYCSSCKKWCLLSKEHK